MPNTFELTTPLGADALLFWRLHAREELSRLSEFEFDLLSSDGAVDPDQILGQNITLKAELPDDKLRHFNGFVAAFAQAGMHGRYHVYRATVRPWLWFLTRAANCRIFQQQSVPDILQAVFNDHPQVQDVKFELTNNYRVRDYCVQYRETDFNFVSRLMEQEGIYYYFRHTEGRHTLVVADSYSAHAPREGYAQIPFIAQERMTRPEQERISEWNFRREIQPGRYVLDDYDFEKPSAELKANSKIKRDNALADYEVYDYPGEYVNAADGEHYVRTRIEELHAGYELARGRSNARGLGVGYLFKLTGHARNDQNREYLVVSTQHDIVYSGYESTGAMSANRTGSSYECTFMALSSQQPFRPARSTPKPFVQGPQTAVVVGPGGDEIYTDKYGRVKAQFHWDRVGEKNENSSCWIRVSHPWAGKNWGMIAIPRIGQEVIVDFIEGDPDQPIITGRVYNAEQMPPYELPANMTQTGIKTRSTKGGTAENCNEIRFEDKIGEEQLFIHAEKNQDIEVENDETHWVGNNRTRTVDANETVTVALMRNHTVGINETIAVGAAQQIGIGAWQAIVVGLYQTLAIGKNRNTDVGTDDTLNVGKNLVIDAGDSITIKTGAASISMKKDGTITIQGKDITINGSGKVDVKASANITMKGSKILQN